MIHIVTNSGLNFVKVVKDYFANKSAAELLAIQVTQTDNLHQLLEESLDFGEIELDQADNINVFQTLTDSALFLRDEEQRIHYLLPIHIRCSSHSLNLLEKKDVDIVTKSCSTTFQSS